jgi:RNA polymerase sigma-70 factor (ECF subfamily)
LSHHALHHALGENQALLARHCRALARSEQEAAEIIQETLLRALEHPPALDRPLGPWLKRVARNLLIDRRREERRFTSVDALEHTAAPESEASLALDARSEGVGGRLVATLDRRQLAVLVLREAMQASGPQTARALGLSPSNVRVIHHRLRGLLQQEVSPDEQRETIAAFLHWIVEEDVTGPADLIRLVSLDASDTPQETPDGVRAWVWLVDSAASAAAALDLPCEGHRLWLQGYLLERERSIGAAAEHYSRAIDCALRDGHPELATRASLCALSARLQMGQLVQAQEELRVAHQRLGASEQWTRGAGTVEGGLLWRRGDLDRSLGVYEDLLQTAPDDRIRAALLHNASLVATLRGQLGLARERALEALENHRMSGDRVREARTLNVLGMALQNQGQLRAADTLFLEAAELKERSGAAGLYTVWGNRGLIAHEEGRFADAAGLFGRAHRSALEADMLRSACIAAANMGVLKHAAGEPEAACEWLARARHHITGADIPHLSAFIDAHWGAAAWAAGKGAGLELFDQAEATALHLGADDLSPILAALRATAQVFASDALREGRSLHHRLWTLGDPPPTTTHAATRVAVDLLDRTLRAHGA